jgi:DNA-binding NarL/FixJ family response regulator
MMLSMAGPIRIYIIDDHDEVRRALAVRLGSVPGLSVVGDAARADEGLRDVERLRPDVVLVETKRADGRGLEVVSWIALSGLGSRVFVLTSYPSEWEHWAVRRAGACHYFMKDIDASELVEHIFDEVLQPH